MNPRSNRRIWIIPPLLAFAAICFYGFLATFEPGDFLAWRIAYVVGFTLSVIGCIATWVLTRESKA